MGTNHRPPEGWVAKRIDEIADVRFSSVDKNIVQGEVPVRLCNYMEVWKNPYIHRGLNFMTGSATKEEIKKFGLRPGDVLLTKDSETKEEIAEPSVVREEIENLVLGYHLALIRPDERQAHGLFLAGQLRLPQFRAQFIRAASGVTRYGLGLEEVKSAIVWMPTIERQQHVAKILRALDEAIEASRAVIEQVRRVKSALMQDLLVNGLPGQHKKYKHVPGVGRIPAEWAVERLDHVATVERGKFTHRPRNEPRFYGGSTPFVQTGDVVGSGDYLRAHTQTLNDQGLKISRLFPKGTILFAIAASVGACTITPYDVAFPDSIVGIRPGPRMASLFLLRLLQSSKKRIIDTATESAQANISLELLCPLRFPVPPIEEQKTIGNLLRVVEERLECDDQRLRQLVATQNALSQGLLTGQIPVAVQPGSQHHQK